ncbi:MAG: PD-(D/E)XK nuclease family protein [bacterium]|nr:PD-(D/E)XK nuclease family protein [bacterium]
MRITKIPQNKFELNYNNVIKWSNFKHRIYNDCKRKFLYRYVGSLVDPSDKEKAEKLKKLKTLKNWQGEIVHRYIDISINIDSIELSLEKFKNEFYSILANPNEKITEYYYGIQITNSQIEEIYNSSVISLKNFWFYYQNNIRKLKEKIIFRDSYNIQTFRIKEVDVLYKPDLVVKDGNELTIFDWKTQELEADLNQFKLYSLAYLAQFESQKIKIKSKIIMLYPTLKEDEIIFSKQDIDEYIDFIYHSYLDIKSFMDQMRIFTQNEFENLFVEIKNRFEKTQNRNICSKCEFRELCFGKGK